MPELGELTRAAVEAAQGDEAVEAFAEEGRTTEASALRGEVEGLTFAEQRGVGVRLISDGRLGYAWAADPSLDEVRDAVRRARENAALAEPDEFNVLPEAAPITPIPRAVPRRERGGPHRPEGRAGARAGAPRDLDRSPRDEDRSRPGRRRGLARRDRIHGRRRRRVRAHRRLGGRRDARGRGRRDADRVLLPHHPRARRARRRARSRARPWSAARACSAR